MRAGTLPRSPTSAVCGEGEEDEIGVLWARNMKAGRVDWWHAGCIPADIRRHFEAQGWEFERRTSEKMRTEWSPDGRCFEVRRDAGAEPFIDQDDPTGMRDVPGTDDQFFWQITKDAVAEPLQTSRRFFNTADDAYFDAVRYRNNHPELVDLPIHNFAE